MNLKSGEDHPNYILSIQRTSLEIKKDIRAGSNGVRL